MKKKKFVIIDAMALAYKGYFAFINRPLTTSSGEPTSAVFAFLNQLFKIIEDTKPDYLAIAFDSKEKTFRHEMYVKYKSSREEMPEDMIPQIGRIKQIIEAFEIPLYILPGFEADDLIGTAVKKVSELGYESYAITPDKDYIQLITKDVKVIKPGKSTDEIIIIDEDKVKADFEFEPIQMIDYLALVGDSSDDIPGVKGIGPKTATPLIKQFGSVENIYEHLDEIDKKGTRDKLEADKENAFLSKKLAAIKTNVDFEFDLEKAKFTKPNFDKLIKIFIELEFKAFAGKLTNLFKTEHQQQIIEEKIEEEFDKTSFDNKKVNYTLITNETDAKKLAETLSKTDLFVFDTETDSLDTLSVNLVGASFAMKANEAFFVAVNPLKEREDLFQIDLSDRLPLEVFRDIFKDVFENEKIKKVCQNGKYDIAVLRTHGINVHNFFFDTMLASYIIDPDQKHGMDDLSEKYLSYKPIPLSDLIGQKKSPDKIFEVDVEKLSDYASEDADITYRLYEKLNAILKKEKLENIAYDLEFPLVNVLEDMEREGIKVDQKSLRELSISLQNSIEEYSEKIFEHAGETFNINSTQQLQKVLFDKLELKPTKKTKTGYSTDARSLELLKGEHEIIDLLLDYRQAAKLKSTYADALPKLIHPKTGRVHTTFNQTVASTGRLSSLDPNLQNIPIRTELGKEIRKAFVPRNSDYIILSADYSQIELRIMASICKDEGLMKAFQNGEDIHRSTAAQVFMVKPEEVTPDMRRKAKEVNFGILYGIGPFGLKNRLGITQNHAKEIIDTYFNTFKNVKSYMDSSIEQAREKGYAETLLGRRRHLKNINSNNRVLRQFEERVAINMPIQGTAADMIKLAMIKIHGKFRELKCLSRMVLQVHDELLFDIHKSELENLKPIIKEQMENSLPLAVPVEVEMGIGDNWLDAH
ncbi:MAG: DNA polymerase I [Melioribacteraceae bacterium]|nr:DNA polymerase I [Melioribacteraceae bacterium]MCF8352951.1 DNA polymerase I [Melioribacteraceae bacterium]MCF8396370.1 DNA polymerase I [Melioribacteraceae bacterium]MCF8417468.1 DNA polymerase I [Melioribacteraceae bacterium]